jgi:RES domain-containing protein
MTTLAVPVGRSSQGLATPFRALAVCSGPPTDDLDIAHLVTTDENRWSVAGEPTLYLAGDDGIALAELGRHWAPTSGAICLWAVDVELDAVVDLRRRAVRSALGIPDDPRWFLDRRRCRELASRLRADAIDGLVVPSVAFLDDLERWNIVVFVDRLRSLARAIHRPRSTYAIERLGRSVGVDPRAHGR